MFSYFSIMDWEEERIYPPYTRMRCIVPPISMIFKRKINADQWCEYLTRMVSQFNYGKKKGKDLGPFLTWAFQVGRLLVCLRLGEVLELGVRSFNVSVLLVSFVPFCRTSWLYIIWLRWWTANHNSLLFVLLLFYSDIWSSPNPLKLDQWYQE